MAFGNAEPSNPTAEVVQDIYGGLHREAPNGLRVSPELSLKVPLPRTTAFQAHPNPFDGAVLVRFEAAVTTVAGTGTVSIGVDNAAPYAASTNIKTGASVAAVGVVQRAAADAYQLLEPDGAIVISVSAADTDVVSHVVLSCHPL